jgi:arabinofuranosyltransferase
MIDRIKSFIELRFNLVFILAVSVLIILAWLNRFVLDDAFIAYRYSYHFVHGHGLVWNVGEVLEGYTSFLWTILMSIPLFFNIDPVPFSFVLGIIFFTGSIIFTYKISLLLFHSRNIGLLTIILLGTNYTFNAFATSGLETQLQACLFISSVYILLANMDKEEWAKRTLVLLSFLMGVAMLTRPDTVILCIVIIAVVVFRLLQERTAKPQILLKSFLLVLPLSIIVGAWLGWKLTYYGDLLPNTYYVKVASATSVMRGMHYLYLFFFSYWLFPFLILGIISIKELLKKRDHSIVILLVLIVLWFLYVVRVGGDFMEFRFMVPVLPFLLLVFVWMNLRIIQQRKIRIFFILLVLLGSLHHALSFGRITNREGIESKRQLYSHIKNDDKNWDQIGRTLGKIFDVEPSITIATSACGALPYYSRLRTIDTHGINDKWVAKHGDIVGNRPGHQRLAPFSYILERQVNILVGHPWMKNTEEIMKNEYYREDLKHFRIKDEDEVPHNTTILEIPIDNTYSLVALYLTKNPSVDEAIQKYRLQEYQIIY